MVKVLRAAHNLCSRHRRWVALALYALVSLVAYVTAYLLRFDLSVPEAYADNLKETVLLLVLLRLTAFHVMGISMERWRYIHVRDLARLVAASLLGTGLFIVALQLLPPATPVPRSVLLLDPMLVVLLVAGLWVAYRMAFEALNRRNHAGPA